MAAMAWLWATVVGAAEPQPCALNEDIRTALAAWVRKEQDACRMALDKAAALQCAPVEPQALARYWLVEGALLHAEGDLEASDDNFAAARRVAPEVWLPDLGPALHERWMAARAPEGTGMIVMEPDPGPRPVWVDGALAEKGPGGWSVPAGLHLVQIGGLEGSAIEAVSGVWVAPGVSALIQTKLPPYVPPPPPAPAPSPAPSPKAPPAPVPRPDPPGEGGVQPALHALLGASGALGEELKSGMMKEPAVKVALPLELGLGLRTGPLLVRAQLGGALLLGGQYLASTQDGALSLPARLDLGLAAAAGNARLHAGVCGGMAWPSRLAGRALAGWRPTGPLLMELRLGANLPTQRSLEPAGELLVGWSL